MGYAGDISCADCWEKLATDSDAYLIDVRSKAEWSFVGTPDLTSIDKQVILSEWQTYPSMQINTGFVEEVMSALEERGAEKTAQLYFLCRSGARSQSAAQAMTAHGYTNSYNVLCGFEGNPNDQRHRGSCDGWKYDGLPWAQQ